MPSSQGGFNLDISGVAGFFGGEATRSAVARAHMLYEGGRWLGWYNQPGSYDIAGRYARISNSTLSRALFPGPRDGEDLTTLFQLDGTVGPKFTSLQSGLVIPSTGHTARLLMEECKAQSNYESSGASYRTTAPQFVTVVNLDHAPPSTLIPRRRRGMGLFPAFVPILVSLAGCGLCAKWKDWYCFSMILLGVVASGVSCLIVGAAILKFQHPIAAQGAPAGDGLMIDAGGTEMAILKGAEDATNPITRGRFVLDYRSEPPYHNISFCSLLLTIQFLSQLLLVPQGTLHGQLLFLGTLVCSWAYNSYVSTWDGESFQRRILVEQILRLQPEQIKKYRLGTRTATVVFVLLVLSPAPPGAAQKLLNEMLPQDTPVWRQWKNDVLFGIHTFLDKNRQTFSFHFPQRDTSVHGIDDALLKTLDSDAEAGAEMYRRYRG
ncbi:hypothetical protein FKP32DRAFT_1662340 [Trametes sanguinea]|nr:hypothetical protein FKP32DRAFT_1662340 [Trametes sanguinea]